MPVISSQLRRELIPLLLHTLVQGKKPATPIKKLFQFVHGMVTALSSQNHAHSEVSLQLFLHGAQLADYFGFKSIAYEFMTKVSGWVQLGVIIAFGTWCDGKLCVLIAGMLDCCSPSSSMRNWVTTTKHKYGRSTS